MTSSLVDAHLAQGPGRVGPLDLHGKKVADIRPDRVDFLRLTSGGATVTVAGREGLGPARPARRPRRPRRRSTTCSRRLDGLEASVLLDAEGGPRPPARSSRRPSWKSGRIGGDRVESGPAPAPTLKLTIGRRDAARTRRSTPGRRATRSSSACRARSSTGSRSAPWRSATGRSPRRSPRRPRGGSRSRQGPKSIDDRPPGAGRRPRRPGG